MRKYLSRHPEQGGPHYPEELDKLDDLVQRAVKALHIVNADERNEVAARIMSLYSMGNRSLEEILEVAIHLHRNGSAILTPKRNRAPA
ncbi:hypothetical protein [Pseudaminobacter soli (ex Li et al. 2025)]|uniref:Uncharacterized protein n=1 Tax=Pseudaminobacter soli (ex Li et al. 2025) TaxID=1295366 RepID=A0A2P7S589_9HYPH|nr:hypothetical protein [Mesorhizobium soli]PSJ57636.1 hypothetical protein C7I85_22025 [Mesorhizobium soli]